MQEKQKAIQFQKWLIVIAIALLLLKITAYLYTHSVAIMTDALESIVNVLAAFMGFYSMRLSSKPKDTEHPYGHGKVEFITSTIEGILIATAGFIIVYEAIRDIIFGHQVHHIDMGIILISITGIINFVAGYFSIQKGKKINSPVLIAGGEHLKTDTYSSLGLVGGMILLYFTNIPLIDSILAILLSLVIFYNAYKIIRKGISGIMDEKDDEIINEIISILNKNRQSTWIDIHNMRVINYAGFYHIDCHVTMPFYYNLQDAHVVLDSLTDTLKSHFKQQIEFFIHADACIFSQCELCNIDECNYRKKPFVKYAIWDHHSILTNERHQNI